MNCLCVYIVHVHIPLIYLVKYGKLTLQCEYEHIGSVNNRFMFCTNFANPQKFDFPTRFQRSRMGLLIEFHEHEHEHEHRTTYVSICYFC